MFFFIIGINTASKQIGNITNVICPSCGAYTSMEITAIYEVLHIFFIPIFKFNRRYIATSRCCNNMFEVDYDEGRAFEQGKISSINPKYLRKSNNYFHTHSCPYCGADLPDDARYCYMCGKPLR